MPDDTHLRVPLGAGTARAASTAVACLVAWVGTAALIASPPVSAKTCSGAVPPLGTVTRQPGDCPQGPGPLPGTRCSVFIVSCGGLTPLGVQVRETPPAPGVPERGTVVIGSGGGGSGFYSSQSNADSLLRSLVRLGFRVIERAWNGSEGWITAEGGLRLEACRYATLLTWIRDSLHVTGKFVATGNSGGSGEIAYALSSYGRAAILDLAVPTGGPPFSRMDYHCGADPAWAGQCPGIVPPESTDCVPYPACTLPPSSPACLQCGTAPTARQLFDDSVMGSGAVLDYPGLQVHFLYGRLDCSSAVSMGLLYANAITSGKAIEFVPNTPHFVAGTPVGREAIRRAIDLGTLGTVSVDRVALATGTDRVELRPRPFVTEAIFTVHLAAQGRARLAVYDLSGRRVATLLDGEPPAGDHEARFVPRAGASAVFFYHLVTPRGVVRGTIMRVR